MPKLPDLAALESVEVNQRGGIVFGISALAFVSAFLSFAIWTYSRCCAYATDLRVPMIAGVVVSAGFFIWILYRICWSDFYWCTNTKGLVSRNLLRKKFVSWEDIKSIPRVMDKTSPLSRQTILAASIWQHLRRHGKKGLSQLPDPALTLWDIIPDDLPSKIEWENPRSVRKTERYLIILSTLLFLLGIMLPIIGLITSQFTDYLGWGIVSLLYAGLTWLSLSSTTRLQPEHISLCGQILTAKMRTRTITLDNSDVVSAYWGEPGMLHIKACGNVHLIIALDAIHEESSRIVLAIIRWLKSSPSPVLLVIPDVLRSTFDGNQIPLSEADTENIEGQTVRLSLADRLAFVALALMFAILTTGLALQKLPALHLTAGIALISVLLSTATWYITGTFALSADQEGFSKTFLWWKIRIQWDHVADYTVGSRAGFGVQNTTLRRLLKDSSGHVLTNISPQCGTKDEWTRFMQYIDSRLLETLPHEKLYKPWKSKPWPAL